jgi:hypothetical protein
MILIEEEIQNCKFRIWMLVYNFSQTHLMVC